MAPEPEAGGGATPDAGDSWGIGGLVGDGRYRMTHRLGRGGMAEVFAAEDVRLGRTVAVKLLRSDLAEDPVAKARFTREAQSVAGLNHHAVVAVYDSGEDIVGGRKVPYIVMELVEGRTIRDLLLNAEAPPPEQALIIVSGVLEALAYSHQHGIVHRDIKPANVIITDSGAVKVMDFGIARALHGAQSTMTQTGMVMGTPQYLSPEQALGKAVDHRSDLYATGCLLYELLAQRPPFVGETPLSVVYQHVQDTPVPPSEVSHDCPPELDGLVMRSLAKEPEDRFQSAEEMRGLVQYGLQMLQQQGGFTGTWNTGAVLPQGPATTAALGSTGATAAMGAGAGYGQYGETAQRPMLPPINPEDGGYTGYNGAAGSGRQGTRGKMLLFVALALVAIVGGVAFALNSMSGTDKQPDNRNPAPTYSQPRGSKLPTPSDTSQDTGQAQDSTSGGDQGGSGYSSTDQQPSPTHSQDQKSSGAPTPSGTSTSGDGSTGGGSGGSAGSDTGGASDSGGSAGSDTGGASDTGGSAGSDTGGASDSGGSAGSAGSGSANGGSAGAGPTGKAVAGTLGG
ncbi:protein kinase domain-containing protein [Streptomyces sp. NRRL F-5126]|uniref:protein kinase domain-containing protein n=1 Tax=Streptomyces sp. NRRL F-5126 TaxID=1463857 RepID=UPI0004C86986|nr:protein kinase [Streptomyces sp. NRRL F-5126]